MTRFDAVRILVRSVRKPLPGRGYTSRFPRLYRVFTATVDRVLPREPCLVKVDGHRMYVDPRGYGVDQAPIFGGDHQADEKHLILSLIQPGTTVIEIGANIGDYTLAFSRKCGPEGRVYAFEASPRTFAVLQKNVELNGYRNTVLVNRAVSDIEGLACLYEDAESSGNSSLFQSAVPAGQAAVQVEAMTLDTFVHSNGIGRFHLLKADAQGSEYQILAGASDCLRRFHPILCLEFWPLGIRQSGAQPEELLELVRSLGYRIFVIRDGVRRVPQLEASSDDEILSECRVRGGERGFCDILAITPAGGP